MAILPRDKNKDIAAIENNHLNLPWRITVTGKGTITYTYDAAGNKLEKITDETASAINNNTAKKTYTVLAKCSQNKTGGLFKVLAQRDLERRINWRS